MSPIRRAVVRRRSLLRAAAVGGGADRASRAAGPGPATVQGTRDSRIDDLVVAQVPTAPVPAHQGP